MDSKMTRRGFLIAVTGSAMAAAAGCRPADVVANAPTPYTAGSGPRPAATVAPTRVFSAANAKPDKNYGLVNFDKIFTTETDKLYDTQYDYSKTPTVDSSTWRLTIDGLVDHPTMIDYAAVQQFTPYEEMRTIECIGNPVGGGLIGNILWKGFHMEDLLSKVGIRKEATHAKFEAADGYSTAVELKWITQPNVMMAFGMNGGSLTVQHGFPLRIMMPGLYGQKMPRWITHIEFLDKDYIGYWEGNGYSNLATVNTNSLIKSPPDDNRAEPAEAGKTVVIQGVAYGAPREITKIEVRVNGGDWMPAKTTHGPNNLTWTQWWFEWVPSASGTYQIAVRATDETGFVQFHENSGVFGSNARNGTDAIHEISVRVAEPKES